MENFSHWLTNPLNFKASTSANPEGESRKETRTFHFSMIQDLKSLKNKFISNLVDEREKFGKHHRRVKVVQDATHLVKCSPNFEFPCARLQSSHDEGWKKNNDGKGSYWLVKTTLKGFHKLKCSFEFVVKQRIIFFLLLVTS